MKRTPQGPGKIPEPSGRRRQPERGCEELAGEQGEELESAPCEGENPKFEQVVLWLFIVFLVILSVVSGYLVLAKLSISL